MIKISREQNVTIRALKSIVTLTVKSGDNVVQIDVTGVSILPEFFEIKPVDIRETIVSKKESKGGIQFINEQINKGIYFVNVKDYTSEEIQLLSKKISKKFLDEIWNLLIKPKLEPFSITLKDQKVERLLIEENSHLFSNEKELQFFLNKYNLDIKTFIEPANFNELEIKLKEIEARFQLEQFFARRYLFCSELIYLLNNRINEFLSNGNQLNEERLKIINNWINRTNIQLETLMNFRNYYKLYDMPEPTKNIDIKKSKNVNLIMGEISDSKIIQKSDIKPQKESKFSKRIAIYTLIILAISLIVTLIIYRDKIF